MKIENATFSLNDALESCVTKNCLEDVVKEILECIKDNCNTCIEYSDSLARMLAESIKELYHNSDDLYAKIEKLEKRNKLFNKIIAGCIGAIIGIIIGVFIL